MNDPIYKKIFRLFIAILKLPFTYLKKKIKQIFCHHTYAWESSVSRHSTLVDKYIVFDYDFKCTKCDKTLSVPFDRDVQLNGEVEYLGNPIKRDKGE